MGAQPSRHVNLDWAEVAKMRENFYRDNIEMKARMVGDYYKTVVRDPNKFIYHGEHGDYFLTPDGQTVFQHREPPRPARVRKPSLLMKLLRGLFDGK